MRSLHLFTRLAPVTRRFVVGLSLVATALGIFLVQTASSWPGQAAARLAKGKKPRVDDYVLDGVWTGSLIALGIALALLATVRWWTRLPPAAPVPAVAEKGGPAWLRGGRFWLVLALVTVAAGVIRWPRLDLSLYNDETYNFRRYIAGDWKGDAGAARVRQPLTWTQTFFGNQQANNGVPYSAVARVLHETFRPKGAPPQWISEFRLRLPAFAGGLASILIVGALGRRLGGPWAGVLAAVLVAWHPWHVRYSTEARPYGYVLALAPLLPLLLDRAVRAGRWRWWFAFAAAEFLLMWSFVGALYYVATLNLAALVLLWRHRDAAWRPLLAANAFAALPFAILFLPCVPQMRQAIAETAVFHRGLEDGWTPTVASFLVSGMPWLNGNPDVPGHPSFSGLVHGAPWLAGAAGLSALLGLGLGARRAWANDLGRLVVVSVVLSAGLAAAAALLTGTTLFPWYVIYVVPPGLAVLAAGFAPWLLRLHWHAAVAALLLAGTVAAQAWPLRTYRSMGKQSLRQVAQALLRTEDGREPLNACWRTEATIYDPALLLTNDVATLARLAEDARAQQRPLRVAYGYRDLLAQEEPQWLELIEKSGAFRLVRRFDGLEEPQFQQWVWEWNGQPLSVDK